MPGRFTPIHHLSPLSPRKSVPIRSGWSRFFFFTGRRLWYTTFGSVARGHLSPGATKDLPFGVNLWTLLLRRMSDVAQVELHNPGGRYD